MQMEKRECQSLTLPHTNRLSKFFYRQTCK